MKEKKISENHKAKREKREVNMGNRVVWVILAICAVAVAFLFREKDAIKTGVTAASFVATVDEEGTGYASYILQYGDAAYTGSEISVDLLGTMVEGETSSVTATGDYEGRENVVVTADEGSVTFSFTVEESGLYAIQVDYYTTEGYGNEITRKFYIDGEVPFDEAESVEFTRFYEDATEVTSESTIRPQQKEVYQWATAWVTDNGGYYTPATYFYLEAGEHELTIESVQEPMAISAITLVSENLTSLSYEDYLEETAAAGATVVDGSLEDGVLYIQAESPVNKSSATLYATSDTTSTRNMPFSYTENLLNVIGGEAWEYSGQWITWEFTVEESGYYNIGIRFKQTTSEDIYFNRTLYIDGEIPFAEAENIHFYYDGTWQVMTFGEDEVDGGYLFYLEAGTHTITLKNTMGDLTNILVEADEILTSLKSINLQLLSVLGSSPDTDRDYQLSTYMPEALAELAEDSERLSAIYDAMLEITGSTGSLTSQLEQLISIIDKMTARPDNIASYYSRFKDLIGTFGEWVVDIKEQPLTVDYLYVSEVSAEVDKSNDGFFRSIYKQVMNFIVSFNNDYSMISSGDENAETTITVWIGSGVTGGRDQAVALSQMIEQEFTSTTGISVILQLVPSSTLKTATFSGRGPDVALTVEQAEPIDFALRDAAYDLTQFEDYEEVITRFVDAALVAFEWEGGVYALPETMTFPMLFYRTDIMEELGIDVSLLTTWTGVTEILADLQAQNMDFALALSMSSYSIFLYQNGGSYYTEDYTASALDSKVALDAFEYWTDFYMQYGLSTDYSFENRFRTGEMPIGIADYTNYNLLSVSAPEITGDWAMTTLPGVVQADGTIDYSAPVTVTGSMILSDSDEVDAAWEFLKWWTSADVQYEFGQQLEAVMGSAARYNTANVEALLSFSWTGNDRRALEDQLEHLVGTPQIPGGYYTERNLKFAWLAVINDNDDPRESLKEYSEDITEEITIKRQEFGLSTAE